LQNEVNVLCSTQELISCVMAFIPAILPQKTNTVKLYGKMFASEIDIRSFTLFF